MRYTMLLLALLALSACGVKPDASTPAPQTDVHIYPAKGSLENLIIVFGDSHAIGGNTDGTSPTGLGLGYAGLVSNKLAIPVTNYAIAGTTLISSQIMQIRQHGSEKSRIKMLMAGYNDSNFFDPTPENLAKFHKLLAEGINTMSTSSELVMIATPPKDKFFPGLNSYANAGIYADEVRKVVTELALKNVLFVDVYATFDFTIGDMAEDTYHFNMVRGQEALSNMFTHAIAAVL